MNRNNANNNNGVLSWFPELYADARVAKATGDIAEVRRILGVVRAEIAALEDYGNERATKDAMEQELVEMEEELLGDVNGAGSTGGGRRRSKKSKKSRKHRKSRKASRKARKTRRR